MANIKCKSCGRRYSYHESDLCPNCGAYNRPSSRLRVDFDKDGNAELLTEEAFLHQSKTGKQREKVCYERKECHEQAVRRGDGRSVSSGAKTSVKAIVLTIAAAAAIGLFVLTCMRVGVLEQQWNETQEPAVEISTEPYRAYYYEGEQFVAEGQPVWVEWVSISKESLQFMLGGTRDIDVRPELYLVEDSQWETLGFLPAELSMTKEEGVIYSYDLSDVDTTHIAMGWLLFPNLEDEDGVEYEVEVDISELFPTD